MRDDLLLYYERELSVLRQLGAQFAVYWPGSPGYFVQGAVDENFEGHGGGLRRSTLSGCSRAFSR